MAFLLFAYRKLNLKKSINVKNYRLMVLSQKQQNISNQMGVFQRMASMQKSMIQMSSAQEISRLMQSFQSNASSMTPEEVQAAQSKIYQTQYATSIFSQLNNSAVEAQIQAQMAPLNAVDSDISIEMANLESQLKLLQAELESVEKAESEAAKDAAPKFGLG